jgi:PAS domain-containing protein
MNSRQHPSNIENNSRDSGDGKPRVRPLVGMFFNIMGAIRQPLIVLDIDLTIVRANNSFYQTFNIGTEEAEGRLIYDLGERNWAIPELKELLEDVLAEDTELNDSTIEHAFRSIGQERYPMASLGLGAHQRLRLPEKIASCRGQHISNIS